MKIEFPKQDTQQILQAIKDQLGGRKLGDLLSFEVQPNGFLVKISKFGTSILEFSRQDKGDKVEFQLTGEKIAFTHKPMKDEMTSKLKGLVEQCGGKVT